MLLVHNILLSFTIGLIVTRYDKSDAHDFGLSIRDFVPNNQDLGINSNIESKVGNPFEIRFECGQGIAVELCEYAHDAIRSGLNRISLEIMITKTIIVNAKYHSFCASESGNPNCREVLGRAQPSAYFPVNTAEGQVHLYPQSLIKQLIVDQPLLLSESDIYADDFPFYFRQRGLEIQANEADFEFVVCHEITHGLGFESGWVDYNSLFNNKIPKGVLAPIPFYSGPSSARFVGFSPLLVMDQYIDGSRISLAEIEQNIRKFQCHNCSASKFVETFQAHSFTMEAASLAYEQATLHSTFASQVQLHTPAVFQQGSSLAHLDTQFDNSSDFLMTWSISSRIGSTLDEVVGTGGIFGGNTLLILKKMGWSTPDSPNTTPVTISLKYTNFSYSSKLSLLWIIVMIATIV